MRIITMLSMTAMLTGCAGFLEGGPTSAQIHKAKGDELLSAVQRDCVISPSGEIGECGLIIDAMHDYCKDVMDPAKLKDCVERAVKIDLAKEKLRYPLASASDAQTMCDANGGCDGRQFERNLLRLHDSAAMKIWNVNWLIGERRSQGAYCVASPDGGSVSCR